MSNYIVLRISKWDGVPYYAGFGLFDTHEEAEAWIKQIEYESGPFDPASHVVVAMHDKD